MCSRSARPPARRWRSISPGTAFALSPRRCLPIKGVGPGELVLAAARDHACDLLVMGGYSRSPWREMLFGGATRDVVGRSLLPLLLSH